ncbi:MAG: hypothetical protein A2934_03085 [Candidatus Sungbacteria bacterium RIFCSPLOWO2_01_FULL_47_10]|uniref:DUF2752 domain-containing protein n=1 Tax=Candidatus Sungbacteria bacterium RIFCSPLOWO2_01_FULL_47_10 TaxID=1802276 RepID=A0A1G2L6V0_9BACT|nr:MAG: hypothetical protein A2934_03085 [Candidatus Sungbacteria bacterium RIFCSPLOWO2_01_FULL_47_10]
MMVKSKILAPFLILGLLTVGGFGFFGSGFMSHAEGGHDCPISLMSGGNCPPSGGILAVALHHIGGLQSFMQSAIEAASSFWTLLALLFFAFLFFSKFLHVAPPISYAQIEAQESEFALISKRRFLRWLSLVRTEDGHCLIRVHEAS